VRDLRRQIAFVPQSVTLFNDTIARNIAYGDMDGASEAQIIEAARHAHAWEFIEQFPEKLHTQVGQNGVLLSGGQRQRLAIARALLKDAPILILDEATSALDSESERKIQQALEYLMQRCTTLVIAHRLTTIQNADRIVVMDQGRVVEQGRHAELLERGGHYAALHAMQFREPGEE
ncbi:MAG: ABC transporter ATP-binding protein, partial [Nevskiales bacterium]